MIDIRDAALRVGVTSIATPRSAFERLRSMLTFRLAIPILKSIWRSRASQFDAVGPLPEGIVFLGDSITEGGLWSDWFPERRSSNRGVSGQTTTELLQRLGSAIRQPRAVFVLAGTNDLTNGSSPSAVSARLALIVDGIHRIAPEAPVYLQSVMPRKPQFAAEILELNHQLRMISAARAYVDYVELWPALAAPTGALRPEFTHDALHLNGPGYRAWTSVLRSLIDALPAGHEDASVTNSANLDAPSHSGLGESHR